MFKEISSDLNFPQLEQKILEFWLEGHFFRKLMDKNKGKKRFSFLDGPITANNPMGVHHAWGRTYKDIFQRYKAMKGFDQRYQNGFDCQGLWVEVEVEKELGFNSKKDIEKYGIAEFVEKCKERVHKYSMVQTEQSIRMGQWMDWGDWKTGLNDPDWMKKSHSYYTMSEVNNYTIWHFLKKACEKNWIYKGTDVMPWCIRCGTSISDMEIATEGYREITHMGVVINLPVKGENNEYILVWTTTPWTLTSNTAVAVHPEMTYVKAMQGDKVYYIAKSLVSVLKGEYKILQEFPGKELVGAQYTGPFDELPAQSRVIHRVIPWKEILETEGTGFVHIAPGCGKEDFLLGKEHKLSVVAPLDELGYYISGFDWLTGMNVKDVSDPIIKNLKDKGLMYRADDYLHRYPVCWRCNSELVFRLVDEWFISMSELRHQIEEVTKKVELWIPSFGLDRELDWLRNMSDWCISKKRYWGLALPIWECSCGHFTVIGGRDELKSRATSGWQEFENHTPHKPWIDKVKIKCEKCAGEVSRIPAVGNPWLDAGIVSFSTMNYISDRKYWEKWFPADFITECFPGQFRNWFYAILTMSTVLENKTPFRVLLGHGLVKDEKGEEMHKSRGNAIMFNEAADKMGADIMRWMFASHNPANSLNFGYTIGSEVKRKFLTLWNVYLFFVTYARIDGFNPKGKSIDDASLTLLDRWILSKLNSLIKFYEEKFDKFETASVTREIETFIDDLSVWYVRRSRRRMWKSENDSDKSTAYIVLYSILVDIVKLLAPVVPFWAEEIYQNLVCSVDSDAPESVHLCDFPSFDSKKIDEKLEIEMSLTRTAVSAGRAARNKSGVKVRQPLDEMYIKFANENEKLNSFMESLIKEELNIKNIKVSDDKGIDRLLLYSAQPKMAQVGPKFGKSTGAVVSWIKGLEDSEVRKLVKDGFIEGKVKEQAVKVLIDDVEISKKESDGWAIAGEGDYVLAVNTKLNEELLSEGFAREFIHKVQLLRKESNFNVSDRIRIYFKTTDKLKKYIDKNSGYIKNETLAVEMIDSDKKNDNTRDEDVNGEKVSITLER